MAAQTSAAIFYNPGIRPADASALPRYLDEELRKIAAAIAALAAGHVEESNRPPAKPRKGDIRLVDGANWSPDLSGLAGVYAYYDAGAGLAWNRLG